MLELTVRDQHGQWSDTLSQNKINFPSSWSLPLESETSYNKTEVIGRRTVLQTGGLRKVWKEERVSSKGHFNLFHKVLLGVRTDGRGRGRWEAGMGEKVRCNWITDEMGGIGAFLSP